MFEAKRLHAIFLPGGVTPAEVAYRDLIAALGPEVTAAMKDLEVYATDEPPPEHSLRDEADGLARFADGLGLERFHLAGYSAGGAVALAFCSMYPDRLLSLALMEPAWAGNEMTPGEADVWDRIGDALDLPPEESMRAFAALQVGPGTDPPALPDEPPPWMLTRPPGLRAIGRAFASHDLDVAALRSFARPVLYVLGGRTNLDYYGAKADRLAEVFPDFRLERFEERHHFDPPHRAEPERLAGLLRAFWAGAEAIV